jgi:hypothetical protein
MGCIQSTPRVPTNGYERTVERYQVTGTVTAGIPVDLAQNPRTSNLLAPPSENTTGISKTTGDSMPTCVKAGLLDLPIERKLNVIMVYTNPAHFSRRNALATEFMLRMQVEQDICLYLVELAYNDDSFEVSDAGNPKHMQLRSADVLWHKENMVNIAVQRLLPAEWQAFAWIDCDVLFRNKKWAEDTLRLLNGTFDIVQLFHLANDLSADGQTSLEVVTSAGYHRARQEPYTWTKGPNYSHPGYAWAMNRKAWDQLGEVIDINILGSGDWILALCLFSMGEHCCCQSQGWSAGYRHAVLHYEKLCHGLRFGYVPGTIDHFFHGHKINRQYNTRASILISGHFDPLVHLRKDTATSLLVPTESFPVKMRDDIIRYYHDRKEDELY